MLGRAQLRLQLRLPAGSAPVHLRCVAATPSQAGRHRWRHGTAGPGALRSASRWRLPKHLIEFEGGRFFCAKKGVVVDPHAGTELPLAACEATAALVRAHAWRLISVSVYISLGLTCAFAELLNEGEHRETLRVEMVDLRAKLVRCRDMQSHSPGTHAEETLDIEGELADALADCRQLDMMRDSKMNWAFGVSYIGVAGALLCRPGCALGAGVLLGSWVGVGLPLAACATVAVAKQSGRQLDWSLMLPP